jgi:hypothetical protein
MINEPLTITFSRTGGGMRDLHAVLRDAVLDADDEHAWMGTEPPHARARQPHAGDTLRYRLEFRRGSERRVVELRDEDRTAHLAPLIDRMIRMAEGG